MGDASDVLMKLRPVTFRYREDVVGSEGAQQPQYGMIAEEVAEVAPDLVAADAEGKPFTVMYHELPALLVNEAQKERRAIFELERTRAEQQRKIDEESAVIETQEHEIAALTARLARLESDTRRTAAR